MQIPISKPYFDEEDEKIIIKPLQSGWVVQGPFVKEFEEQFSTHTKIPYAVACSNCTTALHLSLVALGIGAGDKVVVPSFTYVASANAIEYTGATPIFCDIDLKSFNLDVQKLEEIVAKDNIKAIMPVHLFGLCANMPKIMEIAREYQLKVIEDCACGFDSWIGDRHSGSFGDCGCFSFHPRKAISTGEGGMLATNAKTFAEKVRCLRDHGASKSDLERHLEEGGSLLPHFNTLGYNYRLTDMQGALGVTQMQKARKIMQERRKIARWYDEALRDFPLLLLPKTPEGFTHSYQSYVALFAPSYEGLTLEMIDKYNKKRNLLMQKLESLGISTRQGTHAVHTLGYYHHKYSLKEEDFLVSLAADRLSISLPLYPQMRETEFSYVIEGIQKVFS
ncbi:DegT/DnrJ/EryC1/StrS family aminotransferase [Helicobacter mesocricetorum]|uniref:DegT/DnrJ/EryC1/StrS family aminotransferase n=1 Tax=Helicobacter mesocricetorum TaxID=87012 RepID=UPI000CF0325A|nr:DegT/DnrJ/EryC1/StrS family aminotransferase [Helicobacter mesocricetorum]